MRSCWLPLLPPHSSVQAAQRGQSGFLWAPSPGLAASRWHCCSGHQGCVRLLWAACSLVSAPKPLPSHASLRMQYQYSDQAPLLPSLAGEQSPEDDALAAGGLRAASMRSCSIVPCFCLMAREVTHNPFLQCFKGSSGRPIL